MDRAIDGECFAIGYQGRSLTALCDLLVDKRVELLVDVRERAWSNRPEFRKTALASALALRGIEYVHVREAGNPFRPRGGEIVDAAACITKYRGYLRSKPGVVERLRLLINARRVALLCYEAKSTDCHRDALIAALRRAAPAVPVCHL